MSTQKHHPLPAKTVRTIAVGALSVIAAFTVGLRTADDVTPIGPIEAHELLTLSGDLTGDGLVDEADVTVAIELSEGYEQPTVAQLKADPNRDGVITSADALAILKLIDAAH